MECRSFNILFEFFKTLRNPKKFKKPDDKDLSDLCEKLVIIQSERRMNWNDYFSHPFFQKYQ